MKVESMRVTYLRLYVEWHASNRAWQDDSSSVDALRAVRAGMPSNDQPREMNACALPPRYCFCASLLLWGCSPA